MARARVNSSFVLSPFIPTLNLGKQSVCTCHTKWREKEVSTVYTVCAPRFEAARPPPCLLLIRRSSYTPVDKDSSRSKNPRTTTSRNFYKKMSNLDPIPLSPFPVAKRSRGARSNTVLSLSPGGEAGECIFPIRKKIIFFCVQLRRVCVEKKAKNILRHAKGRVQCLLSRQLTHKSAFYCTL